MPKVTEKQALAIAVAKDVLKQLKIGNMKVTQGSYVEVKIKVPERTDEIQKHLPVIEKKCKVCAQGAAFLSYIRLEDNLTFGQIERAAGTSAFPVFWGNSVRDDILCFTNDHVQPPLENVFDKRTLNLIEVAFEKDDWFKDWDLWHESNEEHKTILKRAVKFGKKYRNNRERLAAIMENIIANHGEFVV